MLSISDGCGESGDVFIFGEDIGTLTLLPEIGDARSMATLLKYFYYKYHNSLAKFGN